MASILDEYEDSLSRSASLQQSRDSVGIPHSGKRGLGLRDHLCRSQHENCPGATMPRPPPV